MVASIGRLSRTALVILVAAMAGCAGQGDIDRTQPDKVDKSIFVNPDGSARTFYYRKTTTGSPPTSAYAYEGIMGQMLKVRFEIQQKYLLGYRAYDYAPGSEGQFTSGTNNQDTPFLMFAISSHFDVKREYNPATGEQTNVISENTTDRPWNERQYMRVDWSQNLADPTIPDAVSADPTSPFFPAQTITQTFSIGEGDEAIVSPNQPIMTHDYVDFTTVEIRTPDYAACMQLFDTWDDSGPSGCGPAQITYRNSLLPVPASEYEPLSYPDNQTLLNPDGSPIQYIVDTNGDALPCTPDNLAQNGLSGADCQTATMGQFSKFGFFRTVRQNYNAQVGATTQQRDYFINRWNVWQSTIQRDAAGNPIMDSNNNPVRMPYSQRKTRTITYYTNPEFPDDDALFAEANKVVDDWNQALKMTVAGMQWTEQNPSRSIAMADLTAAANALPNIVVLQRNDCSMQNVHDFMTAHPDVVATVRKQVSPGTLDIDNFANADLEKACSALWSVTASLPAGDPRHFDWQRNGDLRYSFIHWVDRPTPNGLLGYGPSSSDPETGEIISAAAYIYGAALDTYAQFAVDSINLATSNLDPDDLLSGKTISDVLQETAGKQLLRKHEALSDANRSAAYARFKSLGSQANRLVKVGAGADDRTISSVAGTQLQSLLFNDDVLPGIIPGYKPGGTPPSDVVNTAMTEEWFSSQAREARKARLQTLATNGCLYMAEFADDAILSTALQFDQMHLTPEDLFKALRVSIFRGLTDHEMGHTMGLRHNFAASTDALNYGDQFWQAAVDPTLTDTQKQVNQANYQYASVMDYGARFNTDTQGLAKYDMAAIRFGYGQLIDLIPQATESGNKLSFDIFLNDYTKLPAETGSGSTDISNLVASGTTVASYKDEINSILRGGNFFAERPYKFCSDEFEGNLDCKTWDRGANQREIVGDVTDSFRNYYVFNAYKRNRTTWTIDNYLNRLESHYFNKYYEAFQFFFYYGDSFAGTDFGDDMMLASVDALNALGSILETPEPGLHCETTYSPNVLTPPLNATDCGTNPTSVLNLPDAKPYYIEFSNDFYYQILRVGSLYEKLEALFVLTTTEATFYRVDTFADANRYAVNFYQIFRDQMVNLLSGVIRNDPTSYGATLGEGNVVQSTPVVDLSTYGVVNAPTPPYAQPGVPRVDTPVNPTIRYWALLLSMGRLGSTWDATLDFQNFVQVSVKGSDDDFTVAPGTPVIEYTHPETGVVYRAPDNITPRNIGAQILDELTAITGTKGTPGTLPAKYGTYTDGTPLPDWYTAKAAVDQAASGTDQNAYSLAQSVFSLVDQVLEYRIDLTSDIRLFRKQLNLLNSVSQ